MIRSFQLRLTLQSAVISGLALALFGAVFWHLVADFHMRQLDRDLAAMAHRFITAGDHALSNLHAGEDHLNVFGEQLEGVAVRLTDRQGDVVHQSENWPADVDTAALPRPTYLERTNIARKRRGHGVGGSGRGNHTGHRTAGPRLVDPRFTTVASSGGEWRLIGLRARGRVLHVALDLDVFNRNLNHVRDLLILAILAALSISGLGAWWMARRALKPVRVLTAAAEGVTATDLSRRIDDEGADREFARLIQVFNAMLERLEGSFRQAVRFSADASHELRTPLTVMRGEVETALQRVPAGSEEQKALASQLEEVQRLDNLVGKLLLLSKADSGALKPVRENFDFGNLVRRVCEDIPVLDSGLKVECDIADGVRIDGDEDLLHQLVQNLVVNAVRYNRPGGWVTCALTQTGSAAVLRIGNSGEPIPADQQPLIFNRFHRVDPARSGRHTGLGLSLAREIARIHQAELTLASSDESGTWFELRVGNRST